MFKNWTSIFTTDCCVILLDDDVAVYPIFKNGQTSLFEYAKSRKLKILKNNEISELKNIKVFLRNPIERFASGVHTVIEIEKIKNIDVFLKNIEQFKTYNRHFIPQFYWLIHLFKYYRGSVELLNVESLYKLIPNRDAPNIKKLDNERKEKILSIDNKKYVDVDQDLLEKYILQTVKIESIITDFRNAMS